MKQAIFLTLVVLAFSAMAQDEATTTIAATTTTNTAALALCNEADNLAEYTICQSLEDTCTETVENCSGLNSCLDLVADVYAAYLLVFDFSGVSTCACTGFTCERTGVVYDVESSTSGLVASLGLVGLMKLFL